MAGNILATIVLVPLLHLIISIVVVVPIVSAAALLNPPAKEEWLKLFELPAIIGLWTLVHSLPTTILVGLPTIGLALWFGLRSKTTAAVVGAVCALPALSADVYLMVHDLPSSVTAGFAGFVALLALYGLVLGAVGGLLARYIWLPDPTP